MYKKTTTGEGYVATIIGEDGQTIKETNGITVLPFESEYIIRLRNKTRKRSIADVYIDGKVAAKGIVVDQNEYVDLERYVNDLCQGARFRFVRTDDNRVKDKGEPENGTIEVNFYPEEDKKPEMRTIYRDNHHYYPWRYWDNIPWTGSPWRPYNPIIYCSSVHNAHGNIGGSTSAKSIQPSNASLQDGATVGGSISHQKFDTTHVDINRSQKTTIVIRLKGRTSDRSIIRTLQTEDTKKVAGSATKFCSKCGRERRPEEKFCPMDGNPLI